MSLPPPGRRGDGGRQERRKEAWGGMAGEWQNCLTKTVSFCFWFPLFFNLPSATAITVTRTWTTGMSQGEEGLSTVGWGWRLGSNSPGGFGNASCSITESNGQFQVHLPNLKPQLTNDKDMESRKNSVINSLKGYVGFFFKLWRNTHNIKFAVSNVSDTHSVVQPLWRFSSKSFSSSLKEPLQP